jgi:hypothetical protein
MNTINLHTPINVHILRAKQCHSNEPFYIHLAFMHYLNADNCRFLVRTTFLDGSTETTLGK